MARGKATKKKNQTKVRLSVPTVAPAPNVLPEGWVLGRTCLTCRTTYHESMIPAFQSPDTKDGAYDVTKQLPATAPEYPLCENCLSWHWRTAAKRFGVEKQFKQVYVGYFL